MKIVHAILLPLALITVVALTAGANEPVAPAAVPRTASTPGARVYIVAPADGATVHNPVHVVFGLAGMGVAPAGVAQSGTGHHHLPVDAALPALDAPIPKDDHHLHFGGGQTETELTLAPGAHTLQLLLGDQLHVPHDPAVYSPVIKITVVE